MNVGPGTGSMTMTLGPGKKADETKLLNEWRETQGLKPVKGAQAEREKNRLKRNGEWPPGGKTRRTQKKKAGTLQLPPKPQPASSVSTSSQAAQASIKDKLKGATQPTSTSPPATSGGSVGGTSGVAAATAAAPDPDPNDPIAQKLAKTVGFVKKTWSVEGKFLKIEAPGTQQPILLPIEPKPGPFTPTEEIHDILGQDDLLYDVAFALAEGQNVLVKGPTGVAKTVVFRWFAKQLNWNIITAQIHGGTAPEDLVGEFLPVEQQKAKSVEQLIKFIYAVIAKAALASQTHPTICVLEEVNRIGNQQAFAKIYSLLDDTRQIEIPNKEDANGLSEVITPGKLYFGANMNPADVGYVGTQVLDVAFGRRFPIWVEVGYPPEEIEAEALRLRVKGLKFEDAKKMVGMATMVRRNGEITYPICFPDLVAWATMLPYRGWDAAAERAIVNKADPDDQGGIRDLILLKPNFSTVSP